MNNNDWLAVDVLEDYLDGKLDGKMMHMVEKRSLEDPFVAEALAGLSQSPRRARHLSLLQQRLQARVAQKPAEEKRWRLTSHRLSIAAAAAVLFLTVSILFWMRQNQPPSVADAKVSPQPALPAAVQGNSPALAGAGSNPPSATQNQSPAREDGTAASAADGKMKWPALPADGDNREAVAAVSVPERRRQTVIAGHAAGTQPEQTIAAPVQALRSKAEGISTGHTAAQIPHALTVVGRVYTKPDGQPLPGAVVRIAGTHKAVTTDQNGSFALPVDSLSQRLSVASVGYVAQEIDARAQRLDVALEQNGLLRTAQELAAESTATRPLPAYARFSSYFPLGGWANYLSYLNANNQLTANGLTGREVVLRFSVKENGAPSQVHVVQSQGKAFDTEAIRLVSDGAKWLPAVKGAKGVVQVVVQF